MTPATAASSAWIRRATRRGATVLPRPTVGDALGIAYLALIYVASARVGLAFALAGGSASTIWPPAGIAFAVLYAGGIRLWPGILVGAFASDLASGSPPGAAAFTAVAAVAEAVTAVGLLRRAAFRPQLDRLGTVALLIIRGCAAPAVLGATLGVGVLLATGGVRLEQSGLAWITWWFGDALSILIVGGALVAWLSEPAADGLRRRPVEAAIAVACTAVGSIVLFFDVFDLRSSGQAVAFPIIPVLIWIAFRVGPRGTAAGTLLISMIAIAATEQGLGPFVGATRDESFMYLAVFMGLVGMTGAAVAAVVAEGQAARTALEASGERAARELRRLRAVESIGSLLASDGPSPSTLGTVVGALADVFGYVHTAIFTGDDGSVQLGAQRGYDDPVLEVRASDGVIGRAMRTRATQYLPDVAADPDYRSFDPSIRSEIAAPLLSRDRFLGVLNVESVVSLDELDLASVSVVADRVAAALALSLERAALAELAVRDGLTGLHNRRYFDDALGQIGAAQARFAPGTRPPVAVVMFDLDRFGDLNKQHGHQVGDEVLRMFGRILTDRLRGSDLVARYGGEEFVAVLVSATQADAIVVAEDVRRQLAAAEVIGVDGRRLTVTVSAGCSAGDGVEPTLAGLIATADVGLLMAKRAGRNQVVAA